jgi:uncharacterized protein involved in exopolysaccharide biosynthesis
MMLHKLDRGPQPSAARDRRRARDGMSVADGSFQRMPDLVETRGEEDGSALDLRSMVGVLLRRWKLVMALPVAAVILTAVVLGFFKPQYKSTVEILAADPKRQTNVAEERRLSSLEVDAAAMASEVAVISSKSVALRAARELGLDNDPEFQPKSNLCHPSPLIPSV